MNDESREQFESWIAEQLGHTIEYIKGQRAESIDRYYNEYVDIPYQAWKASRAAQVVKLPEPHAHLIWIQAGYAPDDYWDDVEVSRSEKDRCCDGSERYPVYSEHEVTEMLRAAGITVKGEGDAGIHSARIE